MHEIPENRNSLKIVAEELKSDGYTIEQGTGEVRAAAEAVRQHRLDAEVLFSQLSLATLYLEAFVASMEDDELEKFIVRLWEEADKGEKRLEPELAEILFTEMYNRGSINGKAEIWVVFEATRANRE